MAPDWEADTVFFAASLPYELPAFWRRLEAALARNAVEPRLVHGAKDIWVRDFLPVQTTPDRFVKFRYDPDYLRGFGRLRTGNDVCRGLPFLAGLRFSPLRMDGGNLVASRRLAIITDKAFWENRTRSRAAVCASLCDLLGGARCLVIPAEPGDIFGHADGVVQFLDETTVAVNDYSATSPRYARRLHAVLAGAGSRVEILPFSPDASIHRGVPSAVGNYVNCLRVGRLILVPAYGRAEDSVARRRLQALLPGSNVVSVPCRELARRGGVLHCVSWTARLAPHAPNAALPGQSVNRGKAGAGDVIQRFASIP